MDQYNLIGAGWGMVHCQKNQLFQVAHYLPSSTPVSPSMWAFIVNITPGQQGNIPQYSIPINLYSVYQSLLFLSLFCD